MQLGNLLEAAITLLPSVSFEYRIYKGETVNEFGVTVPLYSEWKVCVGMVQPVEASQYQEMQLDFAKRAINVWGSIDLNAIDVQDHPDQVRFQNRIFNTERCTDWLGYNGWHSFVCTEDKRRRESTPTAIVPDPKIDPMPDQMPLPQEGGGVTW